MLPGHKQMTSFFPSKEERAMYDAAPEAVLSNDSLVSGRKNHEQN